MYKYLILFICIFLLVGCNDKNKDSIDIKDNKNGIVLKKNNENEDYVIIKKYVNFNINNENHENNILEINLNSEDVANVNLEIKSFVVNSYKNSSVYNNTLIKGNVIDYDYYVTDKYISIIQNYYYLMDYSRGEDKTNVFIISLDKGNIVDNKDLLNNFNMNEESFYKVLEERLDSEDVLYSIMNIKNNGYKLFVNNEDKLCILYYEITDDNTIKKELVLN